MAPAPGRLGDEVKMPVQVRMFPEEIATVDAFAAELSQQSYGAAFSRAEALRIAAMEWLKARQARRASVTASPPPREPEAEAEAEAEPEPERAVTEDVAVITTPSPPVEPPSRQAQILTTIAAAGPQGLRPAEVRQATGVPQGTVVRALNGLVKRGQVRKVQDRYVATGEKR
jgi:CRP-like cAMP-binding protein